MHGPLGAAHMRMHVMGVGHVMPRNVGHVHNETLVVGPGLGGCRGGFRTEGRTSHNSSLPSCKKTLREPESNLA